MGASQRHKCEIHNFTVIGDGSCPPYGGASTGGSVGIQVPIVWTRPPAMQLAVGAPMTPVDMNDYLHQGSPPRVFGQVSSDPLPAGLMLSPSGILSGTPQQAGVNGVVVYARNSLGTVNSPAFRITVG